MSCNINMKVPVDSTLLAELRADTADVYAGFNGIQLIEQYTGITFEADRGGNECDCDERFASEIKFTRIKMDWMIWQAIATYYADVANTAIGNFGGAGNVETFFVAMFLPWNTLKDGFFSVATSTFINGRMLSNGVPAIEFRPDEAGIISGVEGGAGIDPISGLTFLITYPDGIAGSTAYLYVYEAGAFSDVNSPTVAFTTAGGTVVSYTPSEGFLSTGVDYYAQLDGVTAIPASTYTSLMSQNVTFYNLGVQPIVNLVGL